MTYYRSLYSTFSEWDTASDESGKNAAKKFSDLGLTWGGFWERLWPFRSLKGRTIGLGKESGATDEFDNWQYKAGIGIAALGTRFQLRYRMEKCHVATALTRFGKLI